MTADDLSAALEESEVGDTVTLRVLRGEDELDVDVRLQALE